MYMQRPEPSPRRASPPSRPSADVRRWRDWAARPAACVSRGDARARAKARIFRAYKLVILHAVGTWKNLLASSLLSKLGASIPFIGDLLYGEIGGVYIFCDREWSRICVSLD